MEDHFLLPAFIYDPECTIACRSLQDEIHPFFANHNQGTHPFGCVRIENRSPSSGNLVGTPDKSTFFMTHATLLGSFQKPAARRDHETKLHHLHFAYRPDCRHLRHCVYPTRASGGDPSPGKNSSAALLHPSRHHRHLHHLHGPREGVPEADHG